MKNKESDLTYNIKKKKKYMLAYFLFMLYVKLSV